MKHITNTLGLDEEIVAQAQVSKVIFIVRATIAALFLMAGFGADDSFFFMLFLAILILAKPLIAFFTTELAITNKRIIGRVGFLNTKTMDAPLNKINNITVEQRLIGKIFNYATIRITTSSGNFKYAFIHDAEPFKQSVSRQIDIFDEERIKRQAMEMANAIRGHY